MNNIQGKVWGETECIFLKNNVEFHRIEVKKNGFCSKHKHVHKYNAFFVEKGKLKISIWKKDYDLIDETIIINLKH
jgi:quercetin dioxygenase-like cupin family protein